MAQLSVIVPVYNTEQYLEKCINSIQHQQLRDLELCIVDDGSADNSPIICDQLVEKDDRILVIHKKNYGVSTARNNGLVLSRGEYIAFVDSDDWLDLDMYSTMLGLAHSNDCDVVMCDSVWEYQDSTRIIGRSIREGYYSYEELKREYYPHLLAMECLDYPPTISNWLCVIRHAVVKPLKYVDGVRYSEDLLFGSQVMFRARSFYYLKGKTFYHYRIGQFSVSRRQDFSKWRDYTLLYDRIYEYFGSSKEFDFSYQIKMVLMIFFFNTINDILRDKGLTIRRKTELINEILREDKVYNMFHTLNVFRMPISVKTKGRILLYASKARLLHSL